MSSKQRDYELLFFFLKYVLLALAVLLGLFSVLAIIYIFVDIPQITLKYITLGIFVVSTLVASFKAGRDSASIITGGFVGMIFMLIRCIISIIAGFTPLLSLRTPFEVASGFLIGVIAAIAGCGAIKKRRYR